MENIKTNQEATAEAFRTWFVRLDVDKGKELQAAIKDQCGWSSDVWYDRMRGRSNFTVAEKAIICHIAAADVFFVDQEADTQPIHRKGVEL